MLLYVSVLYLIYIYTTTRFTLFAKVKVIVKSEVEFAVLSHLFSFFDAKVRQFCFSAKRMPNYFSIKVKKKDMQLRWQT